MKSYNFGETVAIDYCELIHAKGAEVLAEYDQEFYKGMPAATINKYGEGYACYVAFRDKGDYIKNIVNMLLNKVDVVSGFDGELPYGCTAHTRTNGEQGYVFLENYSHETKTLVTKNSWLDIEKDTVYKDSITLEAFETKIVKKILGEI